MDNNFDLNCCYFVFQEIIFGLLDIRGVGVLYFVERFFVDIYIFVLFKSFNWGELLDKQGLGLR